MNSRAPPKSPRARLRQIVPYYTGCLQAEANRGATAIAGEAAPRWFEPSEPDWHTRGMEPTRWPAAALPAGFVASLARHGKGNQVPVFYGYPLLEVPGNGQGGDTATWVPVLLCPIDLKVEGDEVSATRANDPPTINADFLGAIAKTPEERQQATRAVREALADDAPLRGLAEHLRERAGLSCELRDRGLVMGGTASVFTSGLESELHRLRGRPGKLGGTALGPVLGGSGTRIKPVPVVEPVALDDTQRAVVRDAVEHALTVATGPAGTGKTQVVVAALTSVLCGGGTALFASRNHQAVNLVEARMAELVGRPVLMRGGVKPGRRDVRQAAIEALKATLSGAAPGAAQQSKRARERHWQALRRRADLWEKIDRLADNLAAEERGSPAPTLTPARLHEAIAEVAELAAAHWVVRRLRGWVDRALRRRWRGLRVALETAPEIADPPPEPRPTDAPEQWERYLNRVLRRQQTAASKGRRPGGAALEIADALSDAEAQVRASGRAWADAYLRERASALPGRLRADLGAYRAALEQGVDGGDGRLKRSLRQQFTRLLGALPLWSVTNLSVHNTVPLQPGLFDLVVLDEASQSDIASALPLLYRAKRALIIGDANQLRHVATLRASVDRHLREQHELTELEDQTYGFASNSLFDLALAAPAARVHFLDGHYRSHRDIVEFSNRQWYGGRLRVRTDYGRLRWAPSEAPLNWVPVTSSATPARGGGVVVAQEEAAVLAELQALQRSGYDGTVGVVAPFRAQVGRLRRGIARLDARWVAERQLVASTAHGFQGDERDLIVISLCMAEALPRGGQRFLAGNTHLLNVALTRARSTCVLVGDLQACARSGVGAYEALAAHVTRAGAVRGAEHSASALDAFGVMPREATAVGPDEQMLISAARRAGLEATGQYPVDQYIIDLLVGDGTREVLVEVDGLTMHTRADGRRLRQDLVRDARLRARGWTVLRLWAHEVRDNPEGCVERMRDALGYEGEPGGKGPAVDPAPLPRADPSPDEGAEGCVVIPLRRSARAAPAGSVVEDGAGGGEASA